VIPLLRIQFEAPGDPAQVLSAAETDEPTPGPGEVKVRIMARPINPSDILFIRGEYGILPEFPAVPGFEGSGVVESCGEGSEIEPFVKVMVLGRGTWQQFCVIPEAMVMPIPDHIGHEAACQGMVNPFTAAAMLEELNLPEGASLLSTAGASSLGLSLLHFCHKRGIRLICTVRREESAKLLKGGGAERVIFENEEELQRKIGEFTVGRGPDAALDAVGGKVATRVLESLAPGSTMLLYGLLGERPTSVHNGLMLFKGLTLKGFWLARWFESATPEQRRKVTDTVLTYLAGSDFKVPVAAVYPLKDARKAAIHAMKPERTGKILITG